MPTPACGPFLMVLLLCGCGESSRPSAGEEEQLNNAAEMLDSAPDELSNIGENALGDPERSSNQPQ